MSLFRFSFTAILGLALLGCAAEKPDPGAQTGAAEKFEAKPAAAFTIEGKPTKILNTARGEVSVYDPLQDSAVRSKFSAYMKSNFNPAAPERLELREVRQALTQNYRTNYCAIVTDGNCARWDFRGCEGPPPYACMFLPPGAVRKLTCDINDEQHSVEAFKSAETLDDALSKYFAVDCGRWKAYSRTLRADSGATLRIYGELLTADRSRAVSLPDGAVLGKDAQKFTDESGETYFAALPAIVDETCLKDIGAGLRPYDDMPALQVNFDAECRNKLFQHTAGHITKRLIIVVNGEVMSVPTIRGTMAREISITGTLETLAEAEAIVETFY